MKSAISIHNLQFGYSKKSAIFDSPFSFSLPDGVLCGLIGANGIGKSTFLKTLAGIIPQISGDILIQNQAIKQLNPSLKARKITFIQSNTAHFPDIPSFQIVEMGRFPYMGWINNLKKEDLEKCSYAMELTQTQNLKNKSFHSLSDGEKQRIVFAMALAQDTPIILMDEPMAFLDIPAQAHTYQLINKMVYELNKTVIFSTHDIEKAIKSCDEIILITENKIISGQTELIGLNKDFEKLFAQSQLLFNQKELNYISPSKTLCKPIDIQGNDDEVFWTKHFFERIQFTYSCNFSLPDSVIVSKTENGNVTWILQFENNFITCLSFYEILNAIKRV